MTDNYELFKNKKGVTCECTTGVDEKSRSPRLLRCKNIATYLWYTDMTREIPAAVCSDCLERLKAR